MRAAQQAEIEGDRDPAEVERYANDCTAFFERELATQPIWIYAWIATVDDDVAGVAVLTLAPAMPRLGVVFGPDARIRDVYVVPRHRRRGIARALTRIAIERATLLGVSRLTLGTSQVGRPLYESLGFIERRDEMIYAG
jgi:GNAT superfamily N-acetyltransferase